MESKKCSNKKCQRPLPVGYKHKQCENCRNKRVKRVGDVGKGLLGVGLLIGSTALTIATNGKFNLKK